MDALQRYLTLVVVALVIAWSLRFHGWRGGDRQRRRSALWRGFSASLASLLFLHRRSPVLMRSRVALVGVPRRAGASLVTDAVGAEDGWG